VIPTAGETVSSFRAAWRLLHYDAGAMAGFNLSIEGFWRSFFAIAFALPLYAVIVFWPVPAADGAPAMETPLGGAVAAVALSWTLYPLCVALIARAMQLGRSFVPYIVAYNWSNALVPQPLLALALLQRAGLVDQGLADMLQLGLFVVFLWYGWAICRIALGAGPVVAAGFVMLSTLLDMLIQLVTLGGPGSE